MSRIWVPKFKIHEAEIVGPVGGVSGYFRVEVLNRYGQVKHERTREWKQLITDAFMDGLYYIVNNTSGGFPAFSGGNCYVGTGSPTFTGSSTGLQTPVSGNPAGGISSQSNACDVSGADDYREEHITTFEFALGAINATLSEVMCATNGGSNLGATFVDLIRDSGGSPTSFPVASDEQLRVTHIAYRYPFLGTSTGSFTIGGAAGSGSHDYEINMADLGTASGVGAASVFGSDNNSVQSWGARLFRDCSALGTNLATLPTGAVLLSTGADSDSGGARGTASNDGTTWFRTKSLTYGLTNANHANGISGFKFSGSDPRRCYKGFIDPVIPKFAGSVQRILTLQFRYGITRV